MQRPQAPKIPSSGQAWVQPAGRLASKSLADRMSQVFVWGLVSVIMSSLGNDMGVCMVVARTIHYGSYHNFGVYV